MTDDVRVDPTLIRRRVPAVATVLLRCVTRLAAEQPTLTDAQLYDAWVDLTDAAFTAYRDHLAPPPETTDRQAS